MPLILDTGRSGSAAELHSANCITIGLVNNMPDAALEATERQFTDLLRAATPNTVVLLKLFAIPEVPRGQAVRTAMAERYRDIAELWQTPLDGLIVTGTEPRATNLKDEPYWETLSTIVDWAKDHTASAIWSCLAAHAAVLHSDGIERRALKQKRFGVFDCRLVADHPMTEHFPQPLWVPHSRYNDLPEAALASCGYKNSRPFDDRRRRYFRQAGRQLLFVLPRPSGIRGRYAVARIPPRRSSFPQRRTRGLSGNASRIFQ